jgi:thiol:disulfide interchange protein DsbC
MRLNPIASFLLLCLVSATAAADQASLKKALLANFPAEEIESVKKTPYMGLYEVVVGSELFYTDEKATYFFFGHMVDPGTGQSLTAERLQQIKDARRVDVDSLPLDLAIKATKGNGKRRLVVFSDPNCPYCKRLEEELKSVTDVTIYTLLYPVLKNSKATATAIWCSGDRLKAWNDFMLKGVAPAGAKDCAPPLETLLQAGQKHGITGTPTLIFADGSIVPGMIQTETIEKKLNETGAK